MPAPVDLSVDIYANFENPLVDPDVYVCWGEGRVNWKV